MDYRKAAEKALEERARIFGQRSEVLADENLSDAEKRERVERMDNDMDRLAAEARAHVEAGEREGEVRSLTERAGALGALGTPGADRRSADDADEFNAGLRAVALGESRKFEFSVGSDVMERRNTVSVNVTAAPAGGDAGSGSAGVVTPDTFVAQVLDSLEEQSSVFNFVRKISTSTGETMNWPRRASKVSGLWQKVAENGKYQRATDGSFTLVPLGAHKFGAIAEVTEEALNDPALNIGAITSQEMGEDMAEGLADSIWNSAADGSGDFTEGILPTLVNIVRTTVADNTITEDRLLDVQHAILSKYRAKAQWYFNDASAREVRGLEDANGHKLWQPALVAGQPDMLLGKPVNIDSGLPGLADGNDKRGVVFGDLNRYYTLRVVRGISVVRSDEYGFDRDTVALKIRFRGDGMVSDPAAAAALASDADGV